MNEEKDFCARVKELAFQAGLSAGCALASRLPADAGPGMIAGFRQETLRRFCAEGDAPQDEHFAVFCAAFDDGLSESEAFAAFRAGEDALHEKLGLGGISAEELAGLALAEHEEGKTERMRKFSDK